MSLVKTFFKSRYGDDGSIMEADFSQLEVIHLAHLTKDPQLIADITSGMDMHRVRAAELFGIPEANVTKEQRKTAKEFTFQLQYGSGARAMAQKAGKPVELARKFIENYYKRYPIVKQWQNNNISKVYNSAVKTKLHSQKGYPIKKGVLTSETGRRYTFMEGDSPDWMAGKGVYTGFKPTEIKNYPVQGGATGDIVPMILGKINRWLVEEGLVDKVKLMATVHDSIVLDMPTKMCYDIGIRLKKLMEDAPKYYEAIFGVKYDLALKVEISWGPSWGEQTEELK